MHILFLVLLLLQAQPSSIDGVVTKPGGTEPLEGATVTLNPASGESAELRRVAVTGEDGRFTMNDVAPGSYELVAESTQYGYVLYGQRRPDGPGSILSITAGGHITDLRLSMIPTGAVTGRITGRNGELAMNATVHAFQFGYRGGKRALQPVQVATTDDRGEYRLFWLPPGQYVIAAALEDRLLPAPLVIPMPPGRTGPQLRAQVSSQLFEGTLLVGLESFLRGNVMSRVLDDGTVQPESWTPVYYPTTTDPRFATPVQVSPGSTTTGVNIAVSPTRVQRVRGSVIGAGSSRALELTLLPENSLFGFGVRNRGDPTTNGSFEFSGVLPGSYYLAAEERASGLVSTPIPVEVGARDVEGLQVTLVPGVQIGVTLMLDDPSDNALDPQPVAGIGARLIPELPTAQDLTTNGQSGGTGRTTFRNVAPGNYQVEIASTRFYVKSIRFGNQDATDGIQVTAMSPTSLQIVLTTESGFLEGTVSGAGQVIVPGATVVLVPAIGRKRSSLYKSAMTDSTGQYRFENIAPGDYKLFAWDDVETGAWENADFMRLYESMGQPIRISGNGRQDVPLTIIRNP
jgi:protocatechuate 3,4-dioxygenase beta subunit